MNGWKRMVLRLVVSILVGMVGTCHGAFHSISSPRATCPPPLTTRTGTRHDTHTNNRVPHDSTGVVLLGGRDDGVDKGFNLLENASKIVPQGAIVATAKESWKFIWKRMMAELAPQDKSGSYARPKYSFNGKIGEDAAFPDEAGRYHVYLGNPCPWCHRVRLALALRSMDPSEMGVTILVDDPVKASRGGWVFGANNGADPLANCRDLREVYDTLVPGFTGRCTAPLLIDLKGRRIVSNESSDIVRMLGKITLSHPSSSVNRKERSELYPDSLVTQIEETNAWVYPLLNNGVYRCGFATTQAAYDAASADVRNGLQRTQDILSQQPYLCGDSFTEADLRLLPTVLRFDGAYAPLFKAGGTHLRIRNYPAVQAWLQRCWDLEGVKETIDLADANASYYKQLFPLNPGGILPSPVTAEQLGLS